jgi:hypothetical protein
MRAACGCRLGSIPGRLVALWYYKRICLPSASSTYFFGRRFIMQELCQPRVSYSYTLACTHIYICIEPRRLSCACVPCHKPPAGRKRWIRLPPASVCSRSPNKKGERTAGAPRQNLFAQTTLHGWTVPPYAIGKSPMGDKKQHKSSTISFCVPILQFAIGTFKSENSHV